MDNSKEIKSMNAARKDEMMLGFWNTKMTALEILDIFPGIKFTTPSKRNSWYEIWIQFVG